MFFNFAKRLWQPKSLRRCNRRPRVTRLSVEHLEDRLVPSTFEPWQIQQAYGFNQISFNNGAIKGDGTGQTIAIIDAYNDPNISSDVDAFDQLYGLTSSNSPTLYAQYGAASSFLTVVNQKGGTTLPANNPSWSLETSLDVEWAHAMAPGAKIVLVEANSDLSSDLFAAAKYAGSRPGVSVISMSFGNSVSGESASDSDFSHTGVTYVASAGDDGLFTYPGASKNVLAVGGTALTTDALGNYVSETVWNDSSYGGSEPAWATSGGADVLTNPPPASWGESGGGPSPYDTSKSGPDVAYNADPYTGYYVYDSYGESGLLAGIGGTSEGSPQWAALIAIADQGRKLGGHGSLSSSQTLTMVRNSNMEYFDFHTGMPGSIEYTLNGTQYTYSGRSVYGQGTPIANVLVQDLVYGKAPATPTGLKAKPVSSSEIDLSWNSDTDAHSYTLEWSLTGASNSWQVLTTTSGTSYADTGLQAGTKYYFRILASNGLGASPYSASVNATTLKASPPVITSDPTSQTVPAGSTVTFTAAASGNPTPTVQWYVNRNDGNGFVVLINGNNVSGATSTTLTLTNVTAAMSGYEYEAVFTNSQGSATTTAATLTVTPATITLTATTVSDLIADINAANSDPADTYIIDLVSSSYVLSQVNNTTNGANGLPVITSPHLTIQSTVGGSTIERSTASGTPAFRLLDVANGASLTVDGVWLKYGLAQGTGVAAEGGGILTFGNLTLDSTIVEQNKALGSNSASATQGGSGRSGANAAGGGLFVSGGNVTLSYDTFYVNTAQGGNGGAPAGNGSGGSGGSASGGGIYAAGGSLTLNDDTIMGNRALGGNGGIDGGNGGNAAGGGLYSAGATANLNNDYIAVNYAQGGNGGNGRSSGGNGGSGGYAAGGGMVATTGTTTTLTNDYLQENDALGGKGGIGVNSGYSAGAGGAAYGGFLDTYNASTTFNNDTLHSCGASGGQGGSGSRGANGGSGGIGVGGGLLVWSGTLTLTNDTLDYLWAWGGLGGNGGNATGHTGGNGGNGGYCVGGALFVDGGTVTLTNDTIDASLLEAGNGGNGGASINWPQGSIGGNGGSCTGGGLDLPGGSTTLINTLIAQGLLLAGNGGVGGAGVGSKGTASSPDLAGNVAFSDHDLIGDGTGSNVVNGVNGNQVGTSANPINPLLGPLQNNGGPLAGFWGQQVVPTMALLAGSPAINAGDNNYSPGSTDERGYARIAGGTIDIGAFEYQADVSSDVSVSLGSITYNSALQEYVQTVTITNTSSNPLLGPLALQLNNLSSNATLANASGYDNGNPYINFVSPGGQLAAGQSITVTLYFADPSGQGITYNTQEWQNL